MLTTTPAARREAYRRAVATYRTILAPPPRLTVSQWADRYRVLSRESAAEHGRWNTDRAPYLRAIMDAANDPTIERIIVMKPRRVGGTEAGNNIIGFFIDQDPGPIILVQPTVELAEGWSKEHLAPMLRDTPRLRDKVKDPRARDSGNTILQKVFPGGRLTVAGANSGAGFRMRAARVVAGDEIDAWPLSAGAEGDPVGLLIGRTDTFHNRKIILWSTPLLKGLSRIEALYQESDQRELEVACPDCGHWQPLIWGNLRYAGMPEPMYACASCGVLIPESEKTAMVLGHRWTARRPGGNIAGFHWNALASLFDGARWPRLVSMWEAAQADNTRLQVFVNQMLAETWEERSGVGIDLGARREKYPAEVPMGAAVLTAGVDTQDDRLMVTVRGWGAGEESWLIAHIMILGDPGHLGRRGRDGTPDVWQQLDALLAREWQHESGAKLKIACTCVDSGGHHTDEVYAYCGPRFGMRVYPIRGASRPGAPLVPKRPSVNNKARVRLFLLGVDAGKDAIYSRLKITEPGPLYMHFPVEAEDDYFEGLTNEKPVRLQVGGRWIRKWVCPKGKRNEPLDCDVYALAALHLGPVPPSRLAKRAAEFAAAAPLAAGAEPAAPAPVPAKPATKPRKRAGWVQRYK